MIYLDSMRFVIAHRFLSMFNTFWIGGSLYWPWPLPVLLGGASQRMPTLPAKAPKSTQKERPSPHRGSVSLWGFPCPFFIGACTTQSSGSSFLIKNPKCLILVKIKATNLLHLLDSSIRCEERLWRMIVGWQEYLGAREARKYTIHCISQLKKADAASPPLFGCRVSWQFPPLGLFKVPELWHPVIKVSKRTNTSKYEICVKPSE